jgi:predicted AAA+ superfamily ATPase
LKSDYERVNKQSKYFMTDTGLMSSILRWNYDNVFLDSDKSGKITETFVYNELIAQVELQDGEYGLYHYRDREKREIDFILESDDLIVGIEVKSGSTVNNEMFKYLRWFNKNMVKNKDFLGIILYTGENVVPFGKNLYAVPINNLWE